MQILKLHCHLPLPRKSYSQSSFKEKKIRLHVLIGKWQSCIVEEHVRFGLEGIDI